MPVTPAELAHASAELAEARDIVDRRLRFAEGVRIPALVAQRRLLLIRPLLRARSACDRTITRAGALANLVLLSGVIALTIRELASLGTPTFASVLFACVAVGVIAGLWLFYPSDATLFSESKRATSVLESAAKDLPQADRDLEIARRLADGRQADFLKLEAVHQAEQAVIDLAFKRASANLASRPWMNMTGVAFEGFLAEILRLWNYQVTTTPVTGDQGVDLIASKDGRRIAIQAKGYPNSTVGNGAVQEVFAGKSYYKCDIAVVITNSFYTRSCKDLASQVGCRLIDRTDLPSLIDGRIQI